ncbi:hypothetical protein l11_20250 [Neisseria weaveri LMG 5135]|nr:hypothetical protein l11_20250 [Neisseria weaveri LMG 5135]EGV35904.1 hypothetical protein l13_12440 [Neisseria weaveri ATCC 51223]
MFSDGLAGLILKNRYNFLIVFKHKYKGRHSGGLFYVTL